MSIWDDAWDYTKKIGQKVGDYFDPNTYLDDPGAEAEKKRKAMLAQQAQQAGNFANYGQSQFQGVNQGMTDYRRQLQALASGQNSLSREQLRQGLGQQLAQQQAMAASANPNNAAMAARNAAQNMARASYGMSGQAAMAGIQERNQANQLLGTALANQGNMNLQAALQSRQNAMQGYGAQNTGTPEKSWLEKYGPAIIGGMGGA